MNTRELKNKETNVYLFKGEPKNGKSIAAASFPNPYIFDLDRRIRSIAAFYADQNFDYDWFNDFISIDQKLDMFLRRCNYKTLIFDGCTTFAELILNTMIKSRPVNSKTTRAGVRMTQIEDFGGEQRAFDTVFDKLFEIHYKQNVNIIVTAHVIEVDKALKPGVTVKSRSLLTAGKKVAAFLPVRFDEAYHFQVNQPIEDGGSERYEVITHHSGDDWASSTYNLPPRIDFTNKSFYDELMRLRKEKGGTNGFEGDTGIVEISRENESTGIEGLESSDSSTREQQTITEAIGNDSKEF